MSFSIKLRELQSSDLPAVHELLSNMTVVRHMLIPLCSKEGSERFVRDAIEGSTTGAWQSTVRAVTEVAGGRLIGLCGIAVLKGTEEGELWYLVAPAHWGKGAATQAAERLLNLGFGDLRLHRIWACCLPENPASERVLEKIGMRKEGFLRKNLRIHGQWKDSFLYAMLMEEWKSGRL